MKRVHVLMFCILRKHLYAITHTLLLSTERNTSLVKNVSLAQLECTEHLVVLQQNYIRYTMYMYIVMHTELYNVMLLNFTEFVQHNIQDTTFYILIHTSFF